MDRDIDSDEEVPAAPSRMSGMLKLAAHYTMLGFAPVVSVVALAVAVVAVNRGPAVPAQSAETAARIESLSATVLETRNELESIKLTLARERSARAEERRKAEERESMIVRHVSSLQTKLKVAPTLEEQLKEAAAAPVHAAPDKTPAATAPAHGADPHAAPAAAADGSHAAAAHAAPEKKPAASATTDGSSSQLKVLKEAIDKFNKK